MMSTNSSNWVIFFAFNEIYVSEEFYSLVKLMSKKPIVLRKFILQKIHFVYSERT